MPPAPYPLSTLNSPFGCAPVPFFAFKKIPWNSTTTDLVKFWAQGSGWGIDIGPFIRVYFYPFPPPPPRCGRIVLATSRKIQDKVLPPGAYPPKPEKWGVGVVVEEACLLVVLIVRLGRHGAKLVGVLNEVPVAVEHGFGPTAVQCESQAPTGLLEEDGLARPVVDVEEL